MKYGVVMFPTDYSIDPVTLGKACEELGFDSIWFPEHTHIPASRKTPWPGGADLPKEYWHTLDPFVSISAVAATTHKIKLGTGICLVVERDPIGAVHACEPGRAVDHPRAGAHRGQVMVGKRSEELLALFLGQGNLLHAVFDAVEELGQQLHQLFPILR